MHAARGGDGGDARRRCTRRAAVMTTVAAVVLIGLGPGVTVRGDEFPPGCDDAAEDFLDDDELWDNAYSYGMKGMFDEARQCFEVYVSKQPGVEKGWHLLSEIHMRLGNNAGALRHSHISARVGGENASAAEGHFLVANAYMAVFEYGKARQHYYRAIRVDPQHVNSMVNLGVVLGNNNDYAEAIPIYRRALALKPDIMAARHNLGSALHTLKRFGESLNVLPQCVHVCVLYVCIHACVCE